jgi:general secretion pathway protein A
VSASDVTDGENIDSGGDRRDVAAGVRVTHDPPMIEEHWGLLHPPFTLDPDVRFLFESASHREGLARLVFAVRELRGGITFLTGEIGCGKTTLSRALLRFLPPDRYRVALVTHPVLPVGQLIGSILHEFGAKRTRGGKAEQARALENHLASLRQKRIEAVLVVDESQLLGHPQLEELRLLTNLETNRVKLLHIVLIGQPELARRAAHFPELAQRIVMRYHLRPLSFNETGRYIAHRLRVAGASSPLFTEAAVAEAYRHTGGVPRLINILCSHALFLAAADTRPQVDVPAVVTAAQEIGLIAGRSRPGSQTGQEPMVSH